MRTPGLATKTPMLAALAFIALVAWQSCYGDSLENEISGFVLDRAITRVGHDFARHLSDIRNIRGLGEYNLTVYERPSARWGNLIWVEQSHNKVFQIFLFPNSQNIKAIAEQAADAIHQQVQRQKLRELLSDDYDLADDEF